MQLKTPILGGLLFAVGIIALGSVTSPKPRTNIQDKPTKLIDCHIREVGGFSPILQAETPTKIQCLELFEIPSEIFKRDGLGSRLTLDRKITLVRTGGTLEFAPDQPDDVLIDQGRLPTNSK